MDSRFQIVNYNYASSNNSNFNSEKIHYTPIDLMIHNFLEVLKIMDNYNIMYPIAPRQNFHPLGLFKYKHSKKLNFQTLSYGQLGQVSEGFSYQQIVQWELFHKSKEFSSNMPNHFF
jgi:hypothetical protein